MKKSTTQLLIAAGSLAAAITLAWYATPAIAESETQPTPCIEYCDTGAQFIADYAKAHSECGGNRECINQKMQQQGWTTGDNLPR